MTRKSMIDQDELIRRTEEYVNQWRQGPLKLSYANRWNWNEEEKKAWKSAKANVYCRMRAENKERCKTFWLEQMDNGCFKEFFKKYGLVIINGRVRFADYGSFILTSYLNNRVLPQLEKEMNIKGVKLKGKRASGMSSNLLNWEHAEVINEEVSK